MADTILGTATFTAGFGLAGITSQTVASGASTSAAVAWQYFPGSAVGVDPTVVDVLPTFGFTIADTVLDDEGDLAAPPAGVVEVPIRRVSEIFPAPTLVNGKPQQPWLPTSVVREDVGSIRVFVAGRDRTWFRGARTEVLDYQLMDPFGCGPASIRFPAVTSWDELGAGDTAWLRMGRNVDVVLKRPDGTRKTLWSGAIGRDITRVGGGDNSRTMQCVGDLTAGAGLQMHKPRQYLPATDVGTLIARALNTEVLVRRIGHVPRVEIGRDSRDRGSSDQTVMEYVQSILPADWTVGRTSKPRVYRIREKASTGATWTVRNGQRGVDHDLSEDVTEVPTQIYMRGVNASGYAWANWFYPGQDGRDFVPYPFASSSTVMTVGTTDADTSTGTGVSDAQRRMNELNLSEDVRVDGVFSAADRDAVKDVQDAKGLLVDGILGPQTWNALFPIYRTDGLEQAVRLPLAGSTHTAPLLYEADGTVAGPNPAFDPSLLRVERDENVGNGISKKLGKVSAKEEFARTWESGAPDPGWVGTVTLTADPQEGSRLLIREGDRLRLRGLAGADPVLHIAGVSVSPEASPPTVTLTVDEHARDLPTVAAIRAQDEESKDDPLRLPGRRARRTQVVPDAVEPFDGESRAGVVPLLPLFAGLWVVQAIPLSTAGQLAKVTLDTSPNREFYVAFFGDRVTPRDLEKWVGNPAATDSQGRGPYQKHEDQLRALGFIDAIGGPDQPCGYYPGQKTSPWDGKTSTLTGRMVSTAPLTYRSVRPPWIWVAFYAASSCKISGRLLPGPIEG